MALGTPITIINGGIKAVRTVISKRNNPINPNAQITPILTTNKVMNVARNDLKNKKKINAVTAKASPTKIDISDLIFAEFIDLIYGIPEI